MPTYEYACAKCGQHFEVYQPITDDALTTHEDCGGDLSKVFGNVGISFRGKGFYRTDNPSSGRKSSSASGPSTSSSDSSSSTSSDSKPANPSPASD
jgi:putative FmdB family regulatory protein